MLTRTNLGLTIEQDELKGFSRTIAEIEWLLLALVLVYLLAGEPPGEGSIALNMALFFFAAFILGLHYVQFYKEESRPKLLVETWVMIVFMTWVVLYTGKIHSPLLNLYLLPIIAGALSDYTAAQVGMQSRSKNATEAIGALYASISDAEQRKAAIVEVFGNGERGKANVRGKLAESLAKDAPISIKSFLAHCRSVAVNYLTPVKVEGADGKETTTTVGAVAAERGIRAGYDAAKPPKSEPDAPVSTKPPTLSELVAAKIAADGVVAMLAIVESACKATARTLEGDKVHATIVALSAK